MRAIQHVRTPTGTLAVIASTAEKLLAEGVISGTLDGDLHAADAAIIKTAIMRFSVCDFCSTPGASHYYDVPDFGITTTPGSYGPTRSTGGWMACDACDALVRADKRTALVDRAVETMAFPKFSRNMIGEFLGKFWQGMDDNAHAVGIAAVCGDYVENRMPKAIDPQTPRDVRVASVMRATGLDRAQVDALLAGKIDRNVVERITAFRNRFGNDDRRMAMAIAGATPPPLPPIAPHWQVALDKRFEALRWIDDALVATKHAVRFDDSVDLSDRDAVSKMVEQAKLVQTMQDLQYRVDARHLRAAQTYSFGDEPLAAIADAASTLPGNAPLSSIEVETSCGWFWFKEPLPVKLTSLAAKNETCALLWGWEQPTENARVVFNDKVAIRFAGYVLDEHGVPSPATSWYWPLSLTLDEMLARNRQTFLRDYGPSGDYAGVNGIGVDATLVAVEALSRFFLAACVWFKQKILVSTDGHVERHARKRIVREHKLSEKPSVRVIALRASARQAVEPSESSPSATGRKLHVRFVVAGHPRLQRCGPGRADVKLIWIAPYPKGPADAPFRQREKVFAVIR